MVGAVVDAVVGTVIDAVVGTVVGAEDMARMAAEISSTCK